MMVRRIRNRRRRAGASALEMALVLPVYTTLIFGQIEASRLGMVSSLLSDVAREACRVAILPGKTQTDVQTRVTTVLSGSGISVGTVNPSPATWQTDPGGAAVTVTVSVPYSQCSWLQPPLFFGSTTVTASATMSNERP
jgi:Flp pilus assembly protein TadG